MTGALAFTKRNVKEIMRDPMSYVFSIGFPVIMMIIMSVINASIPKEGGMTLFRIDNLLGGVLIFSQTFIMLLTAINVSKDLSSSYLTRLFVTPMTAADYLFGYLVPALFEALFAGLFCSVSAYIISLITKDTLSVPALFIAILTLIPSTLLFFGIGFLFGILLNEKSAPAICSIFISLTSIFGCIWFDADKVGGVILKICKFMPFYYCTKAERAAIHLDFEFNAFFLPLIIIFSSAIVITVLSVFAFKSKMKR